MSEELFELERPSDRTELAALFSEFASALTDGRPLTIETPDSTVSMDVPARVLVELEGEREGGEHDAADSDEDADRESGVPGGESGDGDDEDEVSDPPTVELEIELEWVEATPGESVRVDPIDSSDDGVSNGNRATDERETGSQRTARFEVYRDRADEWRWRLIHWNGNVIADSGEGYTTKRNAVNGLESVRRNVPDAVVDYPD